MLKKKIWANFQRSIELFIPKKLSLSSQIYGFWDPRSGKNLFRIPDPGVKKAPDPGSATLIETRNNIYCPYGHVPFMTDTLLFQNKRLCVGLPELLARTLLGDVAGAPALVAELCTGRGAILHDVANLEN
jgi:hypothetical protein